MRWKSPKPIPKIGNRRRVTRFAWLPTQVESYKYWLSFYISVQRWQDGWVEVDREVPIFYY